MKNLLSKFTYEYAVLK